jgi:hypothetical protein
MLPGMEPAQWRDKAALQEFRDKYKDSPYAFVVYQPDGNPAHANMAPNLVRQFVSDVAGALILAWVLALGAFGFGKRVLIAAALGAFAWLAISVPYWNWYMFPAEFTAGVLIQQLVGWTAAGAVMAWWLGRRERR